MEFIVNSPATWAGNVDAARLWVGLLDLQWLGSQNGCGLDVLAHCENVCAGGLGVSTASPMVVCICMLTHSCYEWYGLLAQRLMMSCPGLSQSR